MNGLSYWIYIGLSWWWLCWMDDSDFWSHELKFTIWILELLLIFKFSYVLDYILDSIFKLLHIDVYFAVCHCWAQLSILVFSDPFHPVVTQNQYRRHIRWNQPKWNLFYHLQCETTTSIKNNSTTYQQNE